MGVRTWLMARFYDAAMRPLEERGLQVWRSELLSGVRGAVLEIGAGTGLNLSAYPAGLERLVLAEPDPAMRRQLQRRLDAQPLVPAVVDSFPAETLAAADASFDSVVTTLVLCSVSDPGACLAEIGRVLRPGGGLFFIEHVLDERHPGIAAWQRRLNSCWRFCCGNCHLTRPTASLIADSGLEIERLRQESLPGAPALVRPAIRGVARKPCRDQRPWPT